VLSITRDYTKLDIREWSNFVLSHPNGNIFQTPEMVTLYSRSSMYEPIVIACLNENYKILGILIALIEKEFKGMLGWLSARAIVYGGPLIDNFNNQVCSLILSEFNNVCKHKVIYSQFRNLWDFEQHHDIFLRQNYTFEEHLDIIIDLQKEISALWENIHPTRRKQINRGGRRGIMTRIVDVLSHEDTRICFSILKQVYNEARLPCPKEEFFENAIQIFSKIDAFKAALAIYNDQIIGFRFFLCYKRQIYDWYAGSLRDHYDKYPNDILPWEVIAWGSKKNYKLFDFGGAGKPGVKYGVRDYKQKFGGRLVNYGRYEKIHKKLAFTFANTGFKVWRIFKNLNIKHG
jgi:serine/alanine adding enzyme